MTRSGDKIEIAQVVLKLVFIYKIENKIQFHEDGEFSTTRAHKMQNSFSVWKKYLAVKKQLKKSLNHK